MNTDIALVGIAKQADKETAAAAPTFLHGVSGGVIATPEISTSPVDLTTGLSGPAHARRESAATVVGYETKAFERAIGLYLLGIMGNVDTVGTEAPYTHTFTAGRNTPWLTVWAMLDAEFRRAGGSKLDSVELEFDGTEPLKVTPAGAGLTIARIAEMPEAVTDETLGNLFMPIGGVYKLDVAGSDPAPYLIKSAKVGLSRGLEPVYGGGDIKPQHLTTKRLTAEVEITAHVDDLEDFWAIVNGADGDELSQVPVYGSFELGWTCGDATLNVIGKKVAYTAEPTEANPEGGPAELKLAGELMVAEGEASQVEIVLVNDVAAY